MGQALLQTPEENRGMDLHFHGFVFECRREMANNTEKTWSMILGCKAGKNRRLAA